MNRFIRREAQVKIGGRKLGPLHLGGRLYTVRPMTAWAYQELKATAGMLLHEATIPFPDSIGCLLILPLGMCAPIAALFVQEQIRPSDARRITKPQLRALWATVKACTDFEWIESQNEKGGKGPTVTLTQAALGLCRALGGAYSVRELLFELPYQEFLAMLEDLAALSELQEPGKPAPKNSNTDGQGWGPW